MFINSIIESTGCYIPPVVVKNEDFLDRTFRDKEGNKLSKPTAEIIAKMEEITQIRERRYECEGDTAYMATESARVALAGSSYDAEELDGIIVAHNFGNIRKGDHQGHLIPNLAAVVKNRLGIQNPKCFGYDVLYGCPGWLLGLQQAHQYIQTGAARSILVIGVESLSRIVSPHDVDSMLFGDGAGAVVIVGEESDTRRGVLGYDNETDCQEELDYLRMIRHEEDELADLRIDMFGRGVFKYAVGKMPHLVTGLLRTLDIPLSEIGQFIFHQANGKMLDAIGQAISQLHNEGPVGDKVPVTLDKLGNTSVATIPTLLDLIKRNKMPGFEWHEGMKVVMASVGAGMHVNCMVYQY